jgi:hypothetical protein
MVAEEAVSNIGPVVGLIAAGNAKGAVDMLKGSARRYTSDAAELGSAVHDLFERMARGEDVPERSVHVDVRPFHAHIDEFLSTVQPEFLHLEESVFSDAHGYAGSFDSIARIQGEVVIVDAKTTRSGVHGEVALQNKAYSEADRMFIAATEEFMPMPAIDASAVFHIRPEGWALYALDYSPDLMDYFLALRKVFDWTTDRSSRVVGDAAFRGGNAETGTQRRGK